MSTNTLSDNAPATYVVDLEFNGKSEEIEADSFGYDESGLHLTLAGREVAMFKYWSGIRLKK